MRNLFFLYALSFALISCSTTRKGIITTEAGIKYELIPAVISVVLDGELQEYTELRIYNVQSAFDAAKLMYQSYGKWNGTSDGAYQENIPQYVWALVPLFGTDERYVVFTKGREDEEQYFTSFLVLDNYSKCLLSADTPQRERILDLLLTKMAELDDDTSIYELF